MDRYTKHPVCQIHFCLVFPVYASIGIYIFCIFGRIQLVIFYGLLLSDLITGILIQVCKEDLAILVCLYSLGNTCCSIGNCKYCPGQRLLLI